jgi:hypothetical protein
MNTNGMMMAFFAMRNKNVSKGERNRALLFGSMAPPSAAALTGILAGQKAVETTARADSQAGRLAAEQSLAEVASTLDVLVKTKDVKINGVKVNDFTVLLS